MEAACIKFNEFGNPQTVLQIYYQNILPPKENEVLVRMLARPINPSDLIPIRGAYSHRISLPSIPGYEGVGIVEEVGSAVSRSLVGQRVLPLRGEGTWQEYVRAPAKFTVPIPDAINDVTAAQLYINPVTAWIVCTEILRLSTDDVVVVNACGSSIGHLFAQLSRRLGFRLIAVTRSKHYTADLLKLGAFSVINTAEHSLHDSVMELTKGLGANSAIDSVGGTAAMDLANCLHSSGIFLSIGLLSGNQINWKELNKNGVNAKLFHLRHWNARVSAEAWQDTFKQMITFIQDKKIQLAMKAVQYDLLQVKEAIRAVESPSRRKKKVFLTSGS